MTSELPIVFIGCSSESVELGEAVQNNLDSVAQVKLWNQGTFTPAHSYINDLIRECNRVDFAVFILSPDDITSSRNTDVASPRDNIIFEAGLFMGALGHERVFLLVPEGINIKIPSDLSGITMPPYKPTHSSGGSWQSAFGSGTNRIKTSIRNLGKRIPPSTLEVYANSGDPNFITCFERLFVESKEVALIGTGFYILRGATMRSLLERIRNELPLEIYGANPYSPNVETRLIEEEIGKEIGSPSPTVGQPNLIRWWGDLLRERAKRRDKSNCKLGLFPFYPSYAMFIFDNRDYFIYPYGYIQLGNSCPVMHFSAEVPEHRQMVEFLREQYEIIKERSADAELIFSVYTAEKKNRDIIEIKPEQLTAFAVYLVPDADSPIYQPAANILGYDVRTGNVSHNFKWPEAIGAASEYGLHVTIADALYCACQKDIDLICEEVSWVANQFSPFQMNLNLAKDFPNEKGIALICQDQSGSLEALHHEMVARVYRKAVASNYNFNRALANRDTNTERTDLMIKHYHAPYILQHFKPHFSLLSAVPVDPEQKEQIYSEVKDLLGNSQFIIKINQIAVMHRPKPKGHWKIYQEYYLGGQQ